MALDDGALAPADDFVSLYRRYRPGRFGELRGQDHVVRALRTAVKDGHVAHAYLFSGPRGTGKTSTARILAKALNCLAPVDGEPCGSCASCIEITRGTSMDVTELDAASNNGVESIRDLISHAALGSPGRSKVYIIDEVHMLSTAAANALLKTLEEPPSHVVFVLATTDPQKVPPTIRSRTQHLEFRLLGADTLETLLKDVRDDAGLSLDDDVVSLAVRKGKGSARDALSALDQVAASGEASDSRPALNDVVEGLCEEDAGRSLIALSILHGSGWGPQQLCVELIEDLRQAFLLGVAPQLTDATGEDRDRLADQGTRLSLARVVRAIELLGRAQVEMRDAPDPQVVLEVAIVRSARSDLDAGSSGLLERVHRLERKVLELSQQGPPAQASAPAPIPTPTREVPPGQKASLGAYATESKPAPAPKKNTSPQPEVVQEVPAEDVASVPKADRPATDVTRDEVEQVWNEEVLSAMTSKARSFFRGATLTSVEEGTVTFSVPNEPHLAKCQAHHKEVEALVVKSLSAPVTLQLLVVETKGASRSRSSRESVDEDEVTEVVDLEGLVEAPAGAVSSVAEAKILEAFPGATHEDA